MSGSQIVPFKSAAAIAGERTQDEALPAIISRLWELQPLARVPTDIPNIDDPLWYDLREVRFSTFRVFFQLPPLEVTGAPVLHVMVCDETGAHDATGGHVFNASVDPRDYSVDEVRLWIRGDWEARMMGRPLEEFQ
ncbi:MAG: hypothetical protein R3C27_11150 [Hyphomonadaceae bacterium]